MINDKYGGVFPETHALLKSINDKTGIATGLMRCRHLEDLFLDLEDSKMLRIMDKTAFPNYTGLPQMGVLANVIDHIESLRLKAAKEPTNKAVDFFDKINFNGIGEDDSLILQHHSRYKHVIDEYFDYKSAFVRDELRDKFNSIYLEGRAIMLDASDTFGYIVDKSMPGDVTTHKLEAIYTLMTYFFEYCDIFEPPSDKQQSLF